MGFESAARRPKEEGDNKYALPASQRYKAFDPRTPSPQPLGIEGVLKENVANDISASVPFPGDYTPHPDINSQPPAFLQNGPKEIYVPEDLGEAEETDRVRRALLTGVGITSLMGAAIASAPGAGRFVRDHFFPERPRPDLEVQKVARATTLESYTPALTKEQDEERLQQGRIRQYNIGPFAGYKVGNLAGDYLGHHGVLTENMTFQFPRNLENMWNRKVGMHPTPTMKALGEKITATYEHIVQEGKEDRTTLADFTKDAHRHVSSLLSHMDWEKAEIIYGLNPLQRETLKSLGSRVSGELLMTIALTEIMATGQDVKDDPLANPRMMDLLLQTAGSDFLTRIPAMGDHELSFGLDQITPQTIGMTPAQDTKGHHYTQYAAASIMNRALPVHVGIPKDMQTPGNLYKLTRPTDQHTYALMLALHNLAETVQKTGTSKEALTRLRSIPDAEFTDFVSANHHLPHPTERALIQSLHLDTLQTPDADFISRCQPEVRQYILRVRQNAAALSTYLAEGPIPKSPKGPVHSRKTT